MAVTTTEMNDTIIKYSTSVTAESQIATTTANMWKVKTHINLTSTKHVNGEYISCL